VLKAMAREPADRYQTAAEFADALESLLKTYGFTQEELRDLLRQMFLSEFNSEIEEVRTCQAAEMGEPAPVGLVTVEEEDEPLELIPDHPEPPAKKPPTPRQEAAVADAPAPTNKVLIWVILAAAIAIAVTAVAILALRG